MSTSTTTDPISGPAGCEFEYQATPDLRSPVELRRPRTTTALNAT